MTTPQDPTSSFRFVHNGACAAFGLIAATAAVLSAVLIFGPLADRKVELMAGTPAPAIATAAAAPAAPPASAGLRIASSFRPSVR